MEELELEQSRRTTQSQFCSNCFSLAILPCTCHPTVRTIKVHKDFPPWCPTFALSAIQETSTLPFLVAPNPRPQKRNIRTIILFESLADYVYRTVQCHSTLHFWQWRTMASAPLFQPDHHSPPRSIL
jgi:hypothetical protein